MYRKIKISVRNLVELVLRSGDIDNSYMSYTRGVEGTRAHQKLQASYGEDYVSELALGHRLDYKNFSLELEGRADGVFTRLDGITIEEIKSTKKDLDQIEADHNPLHWAQVKCYGYMYMVDRGLDQIELKLSYFQLETEEVKEFFQTYSLEELEEFYFSLIDEYIAWAETSFYWLEKRDKSLRELDFPFQDYRRGQRELAVAVYKTIEEGKRIFAQAPTGIGKTMSTLFPALKNQGLGQGEKIFYLTAKTITRQAPIRAVKILAQDGLRLKSLVITAKEKSCINQKLSCNPRDCPYARGHYDRVNGAIKDIFQGEDNFNRELIEEYSQKHQVCPFEFSLDLALWSDLIICDYNYVFDPQVRLKRFFDSPGEGHIFLVDEAHNLVDRAREMYSASINTQEILGLVDIFRGNYQPIYRSLNRLVNTIDSLALDLADSGAYYDKEPLDQVEPALRRSLSLMDGWLVEEKAQEDYDQVLDLYFRLLEYEKIRDYYDQHFFNSLKRQGEDSEIRINCIDPSYLLKTSMDQGRATVLFSATLSPLEYYMDLLGGSGRDYNISLASPFPRENFFLALNTRISTKYRDREGSAQELIRALEAFVGARSGNYFIFFPSYTYMEDIAQEFMARNKSLNIVVQDRNLSEAQREDFLDQFYQEDDLIAFVVMGGIFSEGIDLVGDRLIGAVIVGVGLPMVGFENNMIRDYYQEHMGQGFHYAYTYPGMNKVLQAGGRVIRSSQDRGAVMLVDSRYGHYKYRELLPPSWRGGYYVNSPGDLDRLLKNFWKGGN